MKRCLVTVDTEGIGGDNAIEQNIWGGQERVGIDKIMDICDQYGAKALFFVDMAESYAYGKSKIREILLHIENRGHYTGVHIHPKHMADPARDFLWQYSHEEQDTMLKICTRDYEEMTGHPPLYFRAGKYSVDDGTMELIQRMAYRYDFSYFAFRNWCRIRDRRSINLPYTIGTLTEIPVTVFQMASFGKKKRYEKLDVATLGYQEFRYIMGRIAGQDYDYPISLFLHSFTFLDRQNPRNIQVDDAAIHRFEGMLRFVSQSNSFDFWDIGEDSFQMPSYESWMYQDCPAVRGKVRQIKYLLLVAWRIRHMNRKARWLIGMCMGAGVFLLAAILILIFLWGGALL